MTNYKKELLKTLHFLKYNKNSYKDVIKAMDKKASHKMTTSMLELLDDEISTFTFDDDRDVTYLFVLLDFLPFLVQDKKFMLRTVKELKTVHKKMKDLIHARPLDMPPDVLSKYKILKNLIAKLEDTSLKFYTNLPEDYDSTKEEYISYLIFKSKNIAFYNLALEKFPYIINSKDKDGTPLVDRVMEAYLEALDKYLADINLGPIDDLIYFNKIFKSIILNPKLKLTNEDEQRLLNRIKEYVSSKNYDSNRLNEKLTYFANNLFFLIKTKAENITPKSLNYEYEVHDEFKAANLSEANKIYILKRNMRGVGTPVKIYTYDGEGACELDDGVSLVREDGLFKLVVYVPNIPFYIPEDSIVKTEARRRTRSLYTNGFCNPMFPFILSKDLMSLNTNGYKNVVAFHFDIDELTGNLVNFEIKNETVKIYKNSTYAEFDHSLIHSSDEEYGSFLSALCRVSSFLKREYNEMEEYRDLHSDDEKKTSTSVISSIMLYTGIKTAHYFDERGLPFLYRCHQLDPKVISEISELKKKMILYCDDQVANYLEQLKNIYPKAYYTTKNVGHAGLGVTHASHITAPIRRYPDDGNLWSINKFIFNPYSRDDVFRYEDELARIAEETNSKRRTLDDYETEMPKILSKKHKP